LNFSCSNGSDDYKSEQLRLNIIKAIIGEDGIPEEAYQINVFSSVKRICKRCGVKFPNIYEKPLQKLLADRKTYEEDLKNRNDPLLDNLEELKKKCLKENLVNHLKNYVIF